MNCLILLQDVATPPISIGVWISIFVVIGIALLTFAFFLGNLNTTVKQIKESSNKIPMMEQDINDNKKNVGISNKTLEGIDRKIEKMIDKFDQAILDKITVSKSPMRLNKEGERILKQSKVEDIIKGKYEYIVEQVRKQAPNNAYQAQEILFKVVSNLKNDEELINELETGAFLSGSDINTILYAGAINLRDKVVEELEFNLWDIDKEQV